MIVCILAVAVSACGFAATVGGESGEYLFLYNPGVETAVITSLPEVSTPSLNMADETEIPECAVMIDEIDGETLYRVEPVIDVEYPGIMLLSDDDDYRGFDVLDTYSNEYERIYANKIYSDDNCKVYIEENQLTEEQEKTVAESIAAGFATAVKHINDNFCEYNEQTTILVHDIKDSYYYGSGSSYVAGYFSASEYAAERMIHIDLFPLMGKDSSATLKPENADSTLSHEFTHLVEYSVNGENANVDVHWLAELFALSTEEALYTDDTDFNRFFNVLNDYSNVIKNGAIINYSSYSDNSNDISSNYGLLYTFGKYLKTQYGDDIFKAVLSASVDAESAEAALIEGIKEKSKTEITFNELLKNFYIAFVLNEDSGTYKLTDSTYGYMLNMNFNLTGSLSLKPGAATVIPLFNINAAALDLPEIVEYTAFSSDKDKVLELSLEYDRFVSIDSSLVRLINGNALTGLDENGDVNSDMLDGVIFIPANKYVIFAKEGFVYSRKAATVPVRCVSVSDIEKYVDFEIIVDTLPVIVNYYSKPEYDAEKDGIVFGTQIVNFDFTEGAAIDIYAAAYDENGVLLGATLTKPVFDSKGIVYMRGITFDGLKEDGEYTLKLFVFGSDGKLTPIARSYSVNYSKE